jgi:DNA-directed RNA polymerase subunit alpha
MRIRWRGLELPTQVVCDAGTRTEKYARYTVEPFERGFGTTVGNSLRRVLLSSLEGAAVTSIKVEGVLHEFSTLPGVLEDVAELILNIKQLRVKMSDDGPGHLKIDVTRKGEVTAADIEGGANVEVVNGNLHIATLTEEARLALDMEVRKGRGYRTADENAAEDMEATRIPVDSIFSPVLRVNFKTEDTRVGQRTNYDRLVLDIWTDGTVAPGMALVEASKILRKHLNPFVLYSELGDELDAAKRRKMEETDELVNEDLEKKAAIPISELGLSARAQNCLIGQNIHTVGDLVAMTEEDLLAVRNFGQTSLKEVEERLAQMGLALGMGASPAPEAEAAPAGEETEEKEE